jgi:hypothetical protein
MGKSRCKKKTQVEKEYTSELNVAARLSLCLLEAFILAGPAILLLPDFLGSPIALLQPTIITAIGLILAALMCRFRFSIILPLLAIALIIMTFGAAAQLFESFDKPYPARRQRTR